MERKTKRGGRWETRQMTEVKWTREVSGGLLRSCGLGIYFESRVRGFAGIGCGLRERKRGVKDETKDLGLSR